MNDSRTGGFDPKEPQPTRPPKKEKTILQREGKIKTKAQIENKKKPIYFYIVINPKREIMIPKTFDKITKADIDYLISNKISEIKTLEYKSKLPGGQNSEIKEFLADILSSADSSGGDILYGIQEAVDENGEKTGKPEAVVPLEANPDKTKQRLEDLNRTGIEPRHSVQIKIIDGYGNNGSSFVLLIRIPKSLASPHMVTFKNTFRFYARNSVAKYLLDVHEIRNAFLTTESQAERIHGFLQNRLTKITADETQLSSFTEDIPSAIKPIYDAVWNAFGLSRSYNREW